MFRVRSVLQEFEAQIRATGREHPKARGKSEWKRYGDQSERLKITAFGVDLPDGTPLEITVDGLTIGEMVLRGKDARYERESEKGEHVPRVEKGQVIEIKVRGQVILAGQYYAE